LSQDVLARGVGPLVGFADVAPEGGAVLGVAGLFADLLLALPGPPAGGDEPGPHGVSGETDGDSGAFGVAGDDLADGFGGEVPVGDVAPGVDGAEGSSGGDAAGGLPCQPGAHGAGVGVLAVHDDDLAGGPSL